MADAEVTNNPLIFSQIKATKQNTFVYEFVCHVPLCTLKSNPSNRGVAPASYELPSYGDLRVEERGKVRFERGMANEQQMLEALTPAKPPPLRSNGMESNLPGPSLGPPFALWRLARVFPRRPGPIQRRSLGFNARGGVPALHFPVLVRQAYSSNS